MNEITTKTNNSKPTCVLCHVPLNKLENEEYLWLCPKDKNHKYQLYYEVMAYDSDFGTILGEEEESQIELAGLEGVSQPIIITGSYDFTKPAQILGENKIKSDIPIPAYLKDSSTTKVIDYQES